MQGNVWHALPHLMLDQRLSSFRVLASLLRECCDLLIWLCFGEALRVGLETLIALAGVLTLCGYRWVGAGPQGSKGFSSGVHTTIFNFISSPPPPTIQGSGGGRREEACIWEGSQGLAVNF